MGTTAGNHIAGTTPMPGSRGIDSGHDGVIGCSLGRGSKFNVDGFSAINIALAWLKVSLYPPYVLDYEVDDEDVVP